MKFEEKVKQWVEGLTTDDQLRGVIDDLEISRRRLVMLIQEGEVVLPSGAVEKIRAAKLLPVVTTA